MERAGRNVFIPQSFQNFCHSSNKFSISIFSISRAYTRGSLCYGFYYRKLQIQESSFCVAFLVTRIGYTINFVVVVAAHPTAVAENSHRILSNVFLGNIHSHHLNCTILFLKWGGFSNL